MLRTYLKPFYLFDLKFQYSLTNIKYRKKDIGGEISQCVGSTVNQHGGGGWRKPVASVCVQPSHPTLQFVWYYIPKHYTLWDTETTVDGKRAVGWLYPHFCLPQQLPLPPALCISRIRWNLVSYKCNSINHQEQSTCFSGKCWLINNHKQIYHKNIFQFI